MSQILKEESEEEKRKKQQPQPAQATPRLTLRDKTWKYISDFSKGTTRPAGAFSTLVRVAWSRKRKPGPLLQAPPLDSSPAAQAPLRITAAAGGGQG